MLAAALVRFESACTCITIARAMQDLHIMLARSGLHSLAGADIVGRWGPWQVQSWHLTQSVDVELLAVV